jgi:hypothetical protein
MWLIGGTLVLTVLAVALGIMAFITELGGVDVLGGWRSPSPPPENVEGMVREWVGGYEGVGGRGGSAADVAVDAEGNVYATGSWAADYLTVKYDSRGNVLWSALYNGPASAGDDAEAVAVDGSGNVYVAGKIDQTIYPPSTAAYGLVKYDATGAEQWVAVYKTGGGYAPLTAFALDPRGNAYVSGFTAGTEQTREDTVTIKYDPNGNQLWVAQYHGPSNSADHAWAMAVDEVGNVYVAGATFPGSKQNGDYLTVKYDTNGAQRWVAQYDGPAMADDSAHAIAVDKAGSVYVTGRVTSPGPRYSTAEDYATVKYDAQGEQLWAAIYSGPESGNDSPESLAVDGQGNVVVTGQVDDLVGKGPNYGTVKYDAAGNQLWAAVYNGPGHREFGSSDFQDEARALSIDRAGNAYVTGSSAIDGSGTDWVTAKYDPNGHQEWLVRYGGPGDSWDRADALAVDGLGNVYVAGIARPQGFTVVKYSQVTASATP